MAEQPAIDPMHQFLIHKIVDIAPLNLGGFMLDMSITNSVATLLAGTVLLMVFLALTARGEIVPNRAQVAVKDCSLGHPVSLMRRDTHRTNRRSD